MTLPEGYVVKNTFVDVQERCPMLKRHYSWHAGDDAALMERHISPIWDYYRMSKCHEHFHCNSLQVLVSLHQGWAFLLSAVSRIWLPRMLLGAFQRCHLGVATASTMNDIKEADR